VFLDRVFPTPSSTNPEGHSAATSLAAHGTRVTFGIATTSTCIAICTDQPRKRGPQSLATSLDDPGSYAELAGQRAESPSYTSNRDKSVCRGVGGGTRAAAIDVRLTDQRFTCAAKAYVVTAARRTACLHVSRAMQAARRREDFDFPRQLGCRAEAGPRQVLPQVGQRH